MVRRCMPRHVVFVTMNGTVAEVDASLRAMCEAGDHQAAATAALEAYGPSVYSYLAGLLESPTRADDVFSYFCEGLWRGLPGFEWRCSVRAWAFTLARNAALSYQRRAAHRPDRNLPISRAEHLACRVRTETAPYLNTSVKDRMRSLRKKLTEEEQTILILRVDKNLPWSEVSQVLAAPEQDPASVQKQNARVRKRFQLIKEKLRKWVIEDGLLDEDE